MSKRTNPEPREPAVREMAAATVRVENASGVVVATDHARLIATSWHVVENVSASARVHTEQGTFTVNVLQHDETSDIAILSDHPKLDTPGLRLAQSDEGVAPPDRVYLAGFPGGWGPGLPLVTVGRLAGIDDELWLNADTTWGHSGGPVCVVMNGAPILVGVVIGRAGSIRSDLGALVSSLKRDAQNLTAALSSGQAAGLRLGTPRGAFSLGDFAMFAGRSLAAVAEFVDVHFRTGFTRAASADALRLLLE